MSPNNDAAEQIVNMATNVTIKGAEVATNLAGKGALSFATFLIAVLKEQKKTKGRARIQAFNGKPTKVFVIKPEDMKRFAEEAKKYGILYAAVINRKDPTAPIDVVVNANDAAKVNRIAERFALSTVDVEKLRSEVRESQQENPTPARTENDRHPSARTSDDSRRSGAETAEKKPSVIKQLREIKEKRAKDDRILARDQQPVISMNQKIKPKGKER